MRKLFSLLLVLGLLLSALPAVSAAQKPDELEVSSIEVLDATASAEAAIFGETQAEPAASYATILLSPNFYNSVWEKDESIHIPFILSGGKYTSEKYYIKIYNSSNSVVATAEGYIGSSSLLRNLTINWNSHPAAGTYYVNCYTTYKSSSSKFPFVVSDSANRGTDVFFDYSKIYTDRINVPTDAVTNNWSNRHYAPDALRVDAPSDSSDYIIQLTSMDMGYTANDIIEDENEFNRDPLSSDMHWILLEFWLYNEGTSTLAANDVLSELAASKRFWTEYGQPMTIMDGATFSGDREDHGLYDVELEPGEGDYVYVGILTKVNQGLPVIALETSSGFTYIDTHPIDKWYQHEGSWYYYLADSGLVTGWKQIEGVWYYFDEVGVMQTGNVIIDGALHQFSNGGKWLGKYTSAGWVQVTGWHSNWYYVNSGGTLATGWQQISGKWYYFDTDGAMLSGWQEIKGQWYYLNSYMLTGWQKINGSWYYLGASGAMATGWEEIGGKWYYLGDSGVMATGWQKINGQWYYLNSYMATGWQKIGGTWYYLGASGAMATGWQQINGSWYYFGSSGSMHTGWVKLNNSWYYLNSNGVMVTGTHVIDGVTYTFSNSGVMQ